MVGLRGWLIDVRILDDGAELRFKSGNRRVDVRDRFRPYFYMIAEKPEEAAWLAGQHPNVEEAVVEKKFLSLDGQRRRPVVRVVVDSARNFQEVTRDLHKVPGLVEMAERNVAHYFSYMCDRGLGFFREYSFRVRDGFLESARETGRLGSPDMKPASVRRTPDGGFEYLAGRRRGSAGRKGLEEVLKEEEVDVVFSSDDSLARGDCLHINVTRDISHDIYSDDYRWEGEDLERLIGVGRERLLRVMELSWITGASPRSVSRITPGQLNTFLHVRSARRKGFLVPDYKKPMERPKSLRMLSVLDKGGLIFYPEPGIYRMVAKCDFASMYPNIIVRYNISPETMECSCCNVSEAGVDDSLRGDRAIKVPEAGWRICGRRKGIIPGGLKPVLDRRLALKRAMRTEKDRARKRVLDMRQRALKNILVTCFGYLGFKNFVFSNVECKESVMLFGRWVLMRTKEIAEEMGLEVVYGIVDSVFVKGGSAGKYREFVRKVSEEVGIELELDCIFRKIAFPSARDSSGIANKYYGFSTEGGFEARGIGIRHSDCSPIVMDFQAKAVGLILGPDPEEGIRKAGMLLEAYKGMVSSGRVPLESFAMVKRLRRPMGSYVANAPHVVAAKKSGNPGKSVSFVYSTEGPVPVGQARDIDKGRYHELLGAGLEELTRGLVKDARVSPGGGS